MKNILLILKQHSIQTKTEGARLMALDVVYDRNRVDVSSWVDVTDWNLRMVYDWLGY